MNCSRCVAVLLLAAGFLAGFTWSRYRLEHLSLLVSTNGYFEDTKLFIGKTPWLWRVNTGSGYRELESDVDRGTINVRHGKGDKSRIVGLDPQAWDVLQRWMDTRAKRKLNGRRRVFCTLDGSPLQSSYVRNMLRRLAAKAGINKRCNPHNLRHTHAVELREEYVDVGLISKQLGHSSIAITSRYLDHVAPQKIIDHDEGRGVAGVGRRVGTMGYGRNTRVRPSTGLGPRVSTMPRTRFPHPNSDTNRPRHQNLDPNVE